MDSLSLCSAAVQAAFLQSGLKGFHPLRSSPFTTTRCQAHCQMALPGVQHIAGSVLCPCICSVRPADEQDAVPPAVILSQAVTRLLHAGCLPVI